MAKTKGFRKALALVIAVVVVGAALAGALALLRNRETNPSTDDASIDADVVHVAPSVSGRIVALRVAENQLVKTGDVLFEIDPEPYRYRLAAAEADLKGAQAVLATSRRTVSTETSNAAIAGEQVAQAKASLQLATITLGRVEPLLPKGYVSAQVVDDARTAKQKAEIAYEQAQQQASAAQVAVGDTDAAAATVEARRSALALAERDLRDTVVKAPHDGRVTGLAVKTGEYVTVSQSLFTLVVTEEWFASANFRETELDRVGVGTCAVAYSLIDRSVPIVGKVESIGFGVSDQDRADVPRGVPYVEKSVNWVRVAQRFPVRVRLASPPERLMRLGASAVVEIRPGARC